jgi:hypothetical protein
MGCSLADRWNNNTSNCDHWDHNDFKIGVGALIFTMLIFMGAIYGITYH